MASICCLPALFCCIKSRGGWKTERRRNWKWKIKVTVHGRRFMKRWNSFRKMRVVPFDVPGHKHGRGNPELVELLGEQCVGIDVNSMKPLDNLCHPVSVIREAEELAADAFGAAHAFLMVGGTTSSVQSMILSCCKQGDKIILPRNVHRSAINALVLCGAKPVYVNPDVDNQLGISLGMRVAQVEAGHTGKSGCSGCICQQSHLLWDLFGSSHHRHVWPMSTG